MSFIPEDELKSRRAQNLAPMIDFLFLMLMFFASLAISRVTTLDTEVDLVKISTPTQEVEDSSTTEFKTINITITEEGKYKWITDVHDYPMDSAEAIGTELLNQYDQGLLPEEKEKTFVFLRIDEQAQWEPILKVILAVRDCGFLVHPVYQAEMEKQTEQAITMEEKWNAGAIAK